MVVYHAFLPTSLERRTIKKNSVKAKGWIELTSTGTMESVVLVTKWGRYFGIRLKLLGPLS